MLTLERLTLIQPDFRLFADIGFPDGQIVALIGPSGAGKSTLLSLIGGFIAPTSGRVLWNEADLTALPPGRRPVASLFQDNNLFPHLTLQQNVGLGIHPNLHPTSLGQSRIDSAIAEVGLTGYGARKPGTMSGGQQGRASLARVLVQDRPIVLLDEPFAALGPALKAEMLDLVAEKLAGRLVIMVTHDPNDAKRIASLTSVVAEGQVTAPQPTAALFADPPPSLAHYLGK